MSILNIASNIGSSIASSLTSQPNVKKAQQDFSLIAQALQAGNLPGAKSAFGDLTSQLSPAVQSFSSLGTALSSGSLSQAQAAFSKFYLNNTASTSGLSLFG